MWFNKIKRADLYKEIAELEKDIKRFKKENPDFLKEYNKYLDNLLTYKKLKGKTGLSPQEQFCGLYNA